MHNTYTYSTFLEYYHHVYIIPVQYQSYKSHKFFPNQLNKYNSSFRSIGEEVIIIKGIIISYIYIYIYIYIHTHTYNSHLITNTRIIIKIYIHQVYKHKQVRHTIRAYFNFSQPSTKIHQCTHTQIQIIITFTKFYQCTHSPSHIFN